MWPKVDAFGQYSNESQESDFYDEDDWRLETLGHLVGGKRWDELDYFELLSNYDCLYSLNDDDFHKLFIAIIEWYQQGKSVEEFMSLLLRRMGFLDDIGDFSEVPGISNYTQVFERKLHQKRESARTRHLVIDRISIELRACLLLKEDSWKGIFLERRSEYLYQSFWRWYRRIGRN